MSINSKRKGKRVELFVVSVLRSMGFNARRTSQYSAHEHSVYACDVIIEDRPDVAIEVKARKTDVSLNQIKEWLLKLKSETSATKLILALKINRKPLMWFTLVDDKLYEVVNIKKFINDA